MRFLRCCVQRKGNTQTDPQLFASTRRTGRETETEKSRRTGRETETEPPTDKAGNKIPPLAGGFSLSADKAAEWNLGGAQQYVPPSPRYVSAGQASSEGYKAKSGYIPSAPAL